ncbi:MAG: isoprenylcysteine carboxylmethyltransferase family protein [Oligoflexia bacterium]|nr:isoprenylcysteine carboxylmethyltransferase family protein [Oligoflexia bacterium]
MNKTNQMMPLFMTIVGCILVAYKIFPLFLNMADQDKSDLLLMLLAFISVYVSWMIYELRITKNEIKKSSENFDNHTMEVAAIIKISLLISLFCGQPHTSWPQVIIGIFTAISGILIRCLAIHKIGNLYSHRIRVPEKLIIAGAYKFIRHPAYLGTAIAHTGFVIAFLNFYSLILLAAWYFVIWLRVTTEERVSQQTQIYQDYSAKVKYKLLPFIW